MTTLQAPGDNIVIDAIAQTGKQKIPLIGTSVDGHHRHFFPLGGLMETREDPYARRIDSSYFGGDQLVGAAANFHGTRLHLQLAIKDAGTLGNSAPQQRTALPDPAGCCQNQPGKNGKTQRSGTGQTRQPGAAYEPRRLNGTGLLPGLFGHQRNHRIRFVFVLKASDQAMLKTRHFLLDALRGTTPVDQ